jgi:3'-phosphoadenosine 5'-phosphosulfate (PAPS) 3'-phosphatase/thiamine kinase-like enzyme
MDANRHGCSIIKKYQEENASIEGNLKEVGDIRSVLTQADLDAQSKIIGSLRETWGDSLKIVGEEDESEAPLIKDGTLLDQTLLDESDLIDELLPLEEISLFVDPLDGTREFVEGRLHNVASLIGIARNDKAIAGVVGLPFDASGHVVVHYAMANQKKSAGTLPASSVADEKEEVYDGISIFTGDSNNPILKNATESAVSLSSDYNPRHVIVGGTASKFQKLFSTENSIAILHFKTQLWDTCAPESLINSKGGKVTDLFGSPLVHSPDRKFGNIFAVIASSGEPEVTKLHDQLCANMRSDSESVETVLKDWMGSAEKKSAQAVDIVRDLEGIPLSRSDLEGYFSSKTKLNGYSVPESGAWRGLMSNGGRLVLNWDENSNGELPTSVFYKRIVMADLSHARDKLKNAPHKLTRDVKSYQVETSFLTSQACQHGLIQKAGMKINKVFRSDLRPAAGTDPRSLLDSKFAVLLEDFSSEDGWHQQWLLDKNGAYKSLAEFAKMHAFFWQSSQFYKDYPDQVKELEEAVWQNGGYMQPSLQGYDQFINVNKGYSERLPTFQQDLEKIPELQGADLSKIGERLERIVGKVGQRAHPFMGKTSEEVDLSSYRTLIHGDPKQANIFFRQNSENELEVGLIDFQWCGFGLAATDVAHHISAALDPSCLSFDGSKEQELLDYYHVCLSSELVKFGVASSKEDVEERIFPRKVLQDQYEIALLDICRMVFAYAWRRWKAETEPTQASLNRNAYNKSTSSALWLITRCYAFLETYEEED